MFSDSLLKTIFFLKLLYSFATLHSNKLELIRASIPLPFSPPAPHFCILLNSDLRRRWQEYYCQVKYLHHLENASAVLKAILQLDEHISNHHYFKILCNDCNTKATKGVKLKRIR